MLEAFVKERIEKRLQKIVKKYKVKGLSIGITNDSELVYEKYHGVINAKGTKNSSNKMMMIGSNTKILTALAIMVLYEKNLCDFEVDVRTYLPELCFRSRFNDVKITIQDLLMHVSGLPSDDYDLITNEENDLSDILDVLSKMYLTAKPKSMVSYSNLGYGVLGLVIERISGQSYKRFLKENVIEPLGLDVEILETKALREAHDDNISASFNIKGDVVEDPLSTIISAGSNTYATLASMGRMVQIFLNPSSQNILQESTIKTMLKLPVLEHMLPNSHGIGLGLRMYYYVYLNPLVGPVVGHGGNTFYHHSTLDFNLNHNFGIIVMSNSEKGAAAAHVISQFVFVEYCKALGLEMPKKKVDKNKLSAYNDDIFNKDYVAVGLKLPMYFDRHKQPIYKIQFLKFSVKPIGNTIGVYQAVPRGLSRLPVLSSIIKKIQFIPHRVNGEDVLYIRQQHRYHEATAAFATKYRSVIMNDSWAESLGKYKIVSDNKNLKLLFGDIVLKYTKKKELILEVRIKKEKMMLYLEVLNNQEATVQGYGRGAKETVFLNQKQGVSELNFLGIKAIKDK